MSWNVWNRPSGSVMVDMGISSSIWSLPLPNVSWHSGTWPYTMTPSIDQTLHQLANLLPNWTLLPILTLLPNFWGFNRTLQRVRLANRGRLLLWTPGPVPFGTCICSNVETILTWTCHVYGPFEFRTPLGTSILLVCTYMLAFLSSWRKWRKYRGLFKVKSRKDTTSLRKLVSTIGSYATRCPAGMPLPFQMLHGNHSYYGEHRIGCGQNKSADLLHVFDLRLYHQEMTGRENQMELRWHHCHPTGVV